MNYNHITQAYQNAERQALEEMNDPHLIVLTMFDALLKSMQIFEANIDLKNGGDAEQKSKHFARALTIIFWSNGNWWFNINSRCLGNDRTAG